MENNVALAPGFNCDKISIAEEMCFSDLQVQEKANKLRRCVCPVYKYKKKITSHHVLEEEYYFL